MAYCLAFTALVAAAPTPAPAAPEPASVAWRRLGDGPCGQPVLRAEQARLDGGAPGLCVRAAFSAELDADLPGAEVVLLVSTDQDAALRLFVYRRVGLRLVPRFLGSALPGHHLVDARRGPTGLRVQAVDAAGRSRSLDCTFRGFPLACQPAGSAGPG